MPFDPAAQKVMDKFFTKPEPRADGQTYIDTLLERKPAYTYGETLPYNQDPQGNTSWDFTAGIPGQLLEGWNTWEKTLKGQVAPYMIKDGPGDSSTPVRNPAIDQSAGALSMAVPVGSLGGTAPKGAARMFLGRNSSGADHAALARAEQMAQSGLSRERIWSETGWFKMENGVWAYEVPDIGGQLRPGLPKNAAGEVTPFGGGWRGLDSYLDHPELTAKGQYTDWLGNTAPITKSLTVGLETDPMAAGSFSNGHMDVSPQLPEEFRKTVLHETHHGISRNEGFADGGNIEQFLPDRFTEKLAFAEDNVERLGQLLGDYAETNPGYIKAVEEQSVLVRMKLNAIADYLNLGGEREARNVEKRSTMTPEQLKQNPPWSTIGPYHKVY